MNSDLREFLTAIGKIVCIGILVLAVYNTAVFVERTCKYARLYHEKNSQLNLELFVARQTTKDLKAEKEKFELEKQNWYKSQGITKTR